jgi:YesN/AraC family two-component response regulator
MQNPSDKFQSLVLLYCPKGEKNLSNAAELLAAEISGLAEDNYLITCISRPIQEAKDLHALFDENKEALKNIHLTGRVHILHDKEQSEEKTFLSEEEIQDMFIDMKYHTGKTLDLLNSFFESMDPQKYSLGVIEAACKSLLEKVNEYAAQNQVEICDLTEHFYHNYLFSDGIKKIKTDFTEYIHSTLNAVHLKENDQENLLRLIKNYIDKNYRKKLTLQLLASRFYISPAFCSTLLKENLNMTFNDYINEIRLQKAKQLLSETSLSVNKISDEIGYSNPKYFFKIFKIHSGFTPLEYRSQNGMSESIKH